MGRTKKTESTANEMPMSLTELQPIVEEFVTKLRTIENEIDTLNEDKKELIEEYKEKLDTKTLKLALRAVALKEKVEHKDAFDLFVEILDKV
jgi:hypothetical protein